VVTLTASLLSTLEEGSPEGGDAEKPARCPKLIVKDGQNYVKRLGQIEKISVRCD
jgi:hypothetical protein